MTINAYSKMFIKHKNLQLLLDALNYIGTMTLMNTVLT